MGKISLFLTAYL